jgi:DNA-binding NarL/FixJ family response regulator
MGSRAAVWGIPTPQTGNYSLVVISEDATLADRAIEALARDGVQVQLQASGLGPETLDNPERPPTLILVQCSHDRRQLERILRYAAQRAPGAVVVAVITAGDRVDVRLTLTSGADTLVREEDLAAVLAPAIRAAACGQCSAPADLMRLTQPLALSHRERQILGLVLAGLSNAQIAERLYLAPSTVKTHISTAYRRLGVHSRREATAAVFAGDDALRRTVLTTLELGDEYAPASDQR